MKKAKCLHSGCNRPVIMRCAECGAPVCEFHSNHGRFCSDDCHKYGKRKLAKKKKVQDKKDRTKVIKEKAAKLTLVVLVLAAAVLFGPNLATSVPHQVDLWTEEWNQTNLSEVHEELWSTDYASIYPCENGDTAMPALTPGSASYMPIDSAILLVIGIPPYNMGLFEKKDLCMRIEADGRSLNYSVIVIHGNVTKVKDEAIVEGLVIELRQKTRLTGSELHFISKANKGSNTGFYIVELFNVTAKVNKLKAYPIEGTASET